MGHPHLFWCGQSSHICPNAGQIWGTLILCDTQIY
jgi:hypothetical protein